MNKIISYIGFAIKAKKNNYRSIAFKANGQKNYI